MKAKDGEFLAFRVVATLAALMTAACVAYPLSGTVAPGATIAVPVSGEDFLSQGNRNHFVVPYASGVATDPQRGQLFAVMCPLANPAETMLQCMDASHNSTRVSLNLRYVTRLYPDAGSPAGLENLVQSLGDVNNRVPMSGQVLAFFDIPTALNSIWGPTCTTSTPAPVCMQRYDYALFLGITLPGGAQDLTTLSLARVVRVVRGNGVANDTQVYGGFTSADLSRFVPFPKLVLKVDPTTESASNMYAADLSVSYPSNVVIKDVIEEESLGRHSIISWQPAGTGQINIQLISPKHDVNRVSVVFALNDSTPVTLTNFTINSATLYDSLGNPMSGSFLKDIIR